MKKVIIMVRTSTESQQVEDQHNEMVQFCKTFGYSEEQMVFIETKGASAAKVDDDYLDMIERVKEKIISDKDIECFAVWHINRAARNEGVFVSLKDFLVKHNVQFLVKNPFLKLLNEDGSVNMGMELAFSLMATLAKQDNEERMAKFKRAKDVMRKQGKYTGGRTIKFGYGVDKDGYIVIDEEDSKLVRLIFDMYSTGKWSVRTLYEELYERGYKVNYHMINRMVADRTYVDGRYPQMISQELWNRCEAVRNKNFLSIPKGHKHCFASGVYKCPVCGNNMIANGARYECRHHLKLSAPPHCTNGQTIRIENLDGLLWFVASQEEIKYRMRMDTKKKEEYEEKIESLREKVESAKKKLNSVGNKQARIKELYIDGLIDREEFKKRQNKTLSDIKEYNESILKYEEKIEGFLRLIEGNDEDRITPEILKTLYVDVAKEDDLKEMNRIVKRQIERVTSESVEFHGRKTAQLIEIETMYSGVRRFIYVARKWNGHLFFNEKGESLPGIRKIVREVGEKSPRSFKKISEW